MFSTLLPPVNPVPREYFFVGGGMVLVIGLLVAIAVIAGEQVKKAHKREALLASQRTAVAYCIETLRGKALNNCIQQAMADPNGAGAATLADSNAVVIRSAAAAPGTPGFAPVAFGAAR
jgi:hypothetical protein